ncbi:MAG: hypothetical protein PETM_02702 [Petrimonas sp.]
MELKLFLVKLSECSCETFNRTAYGIEIINHSLVTIIGLLF